MGPGQWTPKQVAGARAISSQVYQSKNPMKTYHQIHQSQILQIYKASAKPRECNGDGSHRPQSKPFVAMPPYNQGWIALHILDTSSNKKPGK